MRDMQSPLLDDMPQKRIMTTAGGLRTAAEEEEDGYLSLQINESFDKRAAVPTPDGPIIAIVTFPEYG